MKPEEAQQPPSTEPVFEVRVFYAPGHFGNSYEVMGEREMRDLLAEAVYWGFNRYGDWFNMEDCSDPFAEERLVTLSHAMWQRKKANFRSAQSLGLACDLIITPNHVYVDQCLPHLVAVEGKRVFGQLICPSKPEARGIIVRNYENLFADLAKSGVCLSALCPCPYDFGGCACEKCKPWILTYAKLMRDIHTVAERYHPGVKMRMIGWWWSKEEHRLFAEWVDREAPNWTKSIFLHIPYGQTDVSDVRLPSGCQRCAFVHTGYADQAKPRDIYGHCGPVIAPSRIGRTVDNLSAHGVTGVMTYSEGVFDDVNIAILGGLSSGKFRTADEVLCAYAQRHYGADHDLARQWTQWMKTWARPFEVDTKHSAETLARLCKNTPQGTWRRRQWELKLELFRLHGTITKGKEWTPQRLATVEEFWAAQEELHRGLWGLGPLRHILHRRYTHLSWYGSWAKHTSEHLEVIGKEQ